MKDPLDKSGWECTACLVPNTHWEPCVILILFMAIDYSLGHAALGAVGADRWWSFGFLQMCVFVHGKLTAFSTSECGLFLVFFWDSFWVFFRGPGFGGHGGQLPFVWRQVKGNFEVCEQWHAHGGPPASEGASQRLGMLSQKLGRLLSF